MSSRSRRKIKRSLSTSPTHRPAGEPPDQPTVMRAGSIADLLGTVPVLLGFHPRRSLVAIAMNGKRLGFRLRVDLPDPEFSDAAADQLVAPLLAQRPDSVILVAYVDAEPSPEVRGVDRLAADAVVTSMRRRLDADDVEVREAIRCDGSRYWSYLCDRPACCPPEGTPYEIESNPTLASAVLNGIEVLPDREAMSARFNPVSGTRRLEMEAATGQVLDEILAAAGFDPDDEPSWDRSSLSTHPELLRNGADYVRAMVSDLDAERAGRVSDDHAARLSVWCLLIPIRDLAWSYIDRENAARHLTLWRSVAQRAVFPFEVPALCLAAFSAWLVGDGSQARCALDRVSDVAPTYSLGTLLQQMLDGYVPPDVWEPFDREAVLALIPEKDAGDCA